MTEMSYFAKSIFEQKYAHDVGDRKETWAETADRVSRTVLKSINAKKSIVDAVRDMIEKRQFMPGGRYLYATGRPFHQVQNCFDGQTEFITSEGIKSLAEMVGFNVKVRNRHGLWEKADVRCFGEQEIVTVTLSNGEIINTTEGHLWWQPDNTRVSTLDLEEVMLSKVSSYPQLDEEGIRHGIIFGDGHLIRNKKTGQAAYSQIVFVNPEKDQSLVSYFKAERREITVGFGATIAVDTVRETKRGTIISLQPSHYKQLPDLGACTPEYARGFIAGLIATDGHTAKSGSVTISCEGLDKAQKIAKLAVLAGCVVTSTRISNTVNPYDGSPREMCTVFIKPASAPIILPSHLNNTEGRKLVFRNMTLEVLSVVRTGKFEPVYCVVAPETESFTLANGVITSNCLLLRAEDSREGWADLMQKSTMALMTGAGIGVDYSSIRPEGKIVRKTGGVATGPLALMQMVNEAGRGIMQGGSRRCLPDDSLITMADGSFKRIADIKVGDKVLTRFGIYPVTNVFDQGVQDLIKITTENGSIITSRNHKLLSANRIRTKTFNTPTEALNLNSKLYKYYAPTKTDGNAFDVDLAYVIGYFLGDGCAYNWNDRVHEVTFQLAGKKHNQKQKEKIVTVLEKLGLKTAIRSGHGDCTEIRCQSVGAYNYFTDLKKPNTPFVIPRIIEEACLEARYAFLAGWWDADGYLGKDSWKLANTHESTRKNLRIFMRKLGFMTSEYGIEVRLSSYQRQMFTETVLKHGFKRSRFVTHKGTSEIPTNIIAIEQVPAGHTFDIEVAEVHEFIADGFVSHNSAIWAGLNWKHADAHKFVEMKNWIPEVRSLKERDFNFPANMDGTNISIQLDDEFFKAFHNEKSAHHSQAQSIYWAGVRQMLKTSEPGFSVDVGTNSGETLRNACCEVSSYDDSDICNLGSINLANVHSIEEMTKVVELGTLFLLAGTVYSDVPYAKVDQVRTKNRRLGLGLMGIHEWLLVRGKKYGPDPDLQKMLEIYQTSTQVAAGYANAFDLSAPVKTRAIAPTGTIGIVAETTTGIEPIFCTAYKRRYKKGGDMNAYQYVIDPTAKRLIDSGVSPDHIEDAYSLAEDVERRLAFQAWVQKYVDHGISSTLNLPYWGSELNNSGTVQKFGNTLMKYLPELRGITCYPDGARGGQPLSPVKYSTAAKHVGEVFYESTDVCDITKGGSCGA